MGLFILLNGAVDLKGAHFLWIQDLTAQDALFTFPFSLPLLGNKFNLIPILMAVSQVFAQRLQTTNIEDPTQKQMATMMPIMMLFMFYTLPSGLSVYWFISNLWQIVFQLLVNKRVREEAEHKAHKAFEERQAIQAAPGGKKPPTEKGRVEKLMAYLEQRAKDAEEKKKTKK